MADQDQINQANQYDVDATNKDIYSNDPKNLSSYFSRIVKGYDLSKPENSMMDIAMESGTTTEKVNNWKSMSTPGRVIFVPCNNIGVPIERVGMEQTDAQKQNLNSMNQLSSMVKQATDPNDPQVVKAIRTYAKANMKNGAAGLRSTITLHVNHYSAKFQWTTNSDTDGKDGKPNLSSTSANGPSNGTRGSADPHGTIALSGYSGWARGGTRDGAFNGNPEIEINYLKTIFGVWEPLSADARLVSYIYGNSVQDVQAGLPPKDPSMYLWDMYYYVPGFTPNNGVAESNSPMRYFGYVQTLNISQEASDHSNFNEFKWDMAFKVLQRRENLNGTLSVGP